MLWLCSCIFFDLWWNKRHGLMASRKAVVDVWPGFSPVWVQDEIGWVQWSEFLALDPCSEVEWDSSNKGNLDDSINLQAWLPENSSSTTAMDPSSNPTVNKTIQKTNVATVILENRYYPKKWPSAEMPPLAIKWSGYKQTTRLWQLPSHCKERSC